jgi:hypothetical protein
MHTIGPRALRIRAQNWTQNVINNVTMYHMQLLCRVGVHQNEVNQREVRSVG